MKSKRILAFIVIILMLCISVNAYNDLSDGTALGITAEGAILIDAETDTILYRKNINQQCRPASLTKMMTLLVAYEENAQHPRLKADELVTVTNEMIDVPSGSSIANLSTGDMLSLNDLYYAMMLPSGNDAAQALAFVTSGSEKAFVELMNRKAEELGMADTHYMNAHGFDEEGHYTTTYDLALLARALCANKRLVEIFSSYKYTATVYPNGDTSNPKDVTYYNTNDMLNPKSASYYEGSMGIKTGYTNLAGNCLASFCMKNGRSLIAVVTHSEQNCRDTDTKALFNYGLQKFDTFDVNDVCASKTIVVDVANAAGDDESNGQLGLYLQADKNTKIMTFTKDEGTKIRTFNESAVSIRYPEVMAPVRAGDNVGTVEFVYNNEVIFSAPALASRNVDAEITSFADLVSLGIKGKIRISFGFMTSKWFLIPVITIAVLALFAFAALALRKRQASRVRSRQKNIRRHRRSRSTRPGNRM